MACDNPVYIKSKGIDIPVPCNKCPPCKVRRINEWVFRISWEEYNLSTSSHFITLTYDTAHVPLTKNGFTTLRKTDLQKFWKRLRKLCPNVQLRYFACGEYGSRTHRPHYHAIVLNCPDPEFFAKAWSLGGVQFGGVFVGTVTSDSIAYVLKYIDKESFKQKKYRHVRDDREFEFQLQSNGLGAGYLDNPSVKSWHKQDLSRNYVVKPGGYKVALSRYYRNKLYDEGELAAQRDIINVAVEQKQQKDAYLFVSSDEFPTLADRKDMEKQARVIKFVNAQKRRSKI